jgi:hypothetical protein
MSLSQPSLATPTVTITYGTIELIIAEDTLTRNTAPFTATNPSDDLNKVDDTALLDAYKSQFKVLTDHPKSIPLQRAYATLIVFHRISKNPQLDLDYQRAKDELMGPSAEDTLLFIVAKLLRYDDAELLQYFQRPHTLLSSLMECRQDFILGEGNVLALFQEARKQCADPSTERLTMKEFRALYQRLDPQAVRAPTAASTATTASAAAASSGRSDGHEPADDHEPADGHERSEGKEQKEDSDGNEAADVSTSSIRTRTASSSSSSPPSPTKPVYRSGTPASTRRKKRRAQTVCLVCRLNDRPSEILLCDRVGCTTECHYDCVEPPLSAVPEGSWFCAACKPLVKQALLEERSLTARQGSEEKNDSEERKAENDAVSEMTVEQWRQEQQRWRLDKEALQKTLADRDAELVRLRAEVERYHQQQSAEEREPHDSDQSDERKDAAAEQHTPSKRRRDPASIDDEHEPDESDASIGDEQDERKEAPPAQSPAEEEQKEAPQTGRWARGSRKIRNNLNKRRWRGRARS